MIHKAGFQLVLENDRIFVINDQNHEVKEITEN